MGRAFQNPYLRQERANLHQRLYDVPLHPPYVPPPPEWDGMGSPCTIRQLLTALSHWRGAGATNHPAGFWPHVLELETGPIYLLGPRLSALHQLLTDTQLIRLLCEGCPFNRPQAQIAAASLHSIELDRDDPAARMRAIMCASIFAEWRGDGSELRALPGTGCRLPHTRATMGRLIAGLNEHMFQQDERDETEEAYQAEYPPDGIPLGGFFPPPPSPQDGEPSGSGGAGPATTPRAATTASLRSASPTSGSGGTADGPPRRRLRSSGIQPPARASGGSRRRGSGPAAAPPAADAARPGSPAPPDDAGAVAADP